MENKVKGIAICDFGLEDFLKDEIENKVNSNEKTLKIFEKNKGLLIFETKLNELLNLIYHDQLAKRIGLFINKISITQIINNNYLDFDLLNNFVLEYGINNIFVLVERHGNHKYNSVEFSKIISKKLFKFKDLKSRIKFTYNNFDMILFIYILNDDAYFFIDLSGFDLSKRDYRIFNTIRSIKGTTAACVVYSIINNIEGQKKNTSKYLDFNIDSGNIVIELTHNLLNKSVHFYKKKEFIFNKYFKYHFDDKINDIKSNILAFSNNNQHLSFSKRNSEIANVKKYIRFGKSNFKDLDLKFSKDVDFILSYIYNDFTNIKELIKNLKYILKDKHKLAFLYHKSYKFIPNINEILINNTDYIINQYHLFQGKQEYSLITYNTL